MTTDPSARFPIVGYDATKASVARMYDHYLGGVEAFPVDIAAAERVEAKAPAAPYGLRANRKFLKRAVEYLAGQGIRQFIDIGAGLPTQENTHQVAQKLIPDARVAYFDNDARALARGRELLEVDNGTAMIRGDCRDPESILTNPRLREIIDLERPVAILFVAILHFIPDEYDPRGIVQAFRDATPSGSYVTISAATTDGPDPAEIDAIKEVYAANATAPGVFRTREEIEGFFDGYNLVDPGVVRIPDWRPLSAPTPEDRKGAEFFYAGVGVKK